MAGQAKIVRFIGDVHGKYEPYKRLLKNSPPSIQVGDMGVGFRRMQGPLEGEFYSNPPHYAMVPGNHRFIRGNHDNPGECKKHSQFIPDGTVEGGMMLIGGAVSVDRAYRMEGYSWWPDEELSELELNELIDKYITTRPRVMVTHDCPEEIAETVVDHDRASMDRKAYPTKLDPEHASRSRRAFQSMWSSHSPELWIFGHWHKPFDHVLRGTRFICLAELEWKDLDIG